MNGGLQMVSGRLKRNAVAKLGSAVKKKDAGGLCHLFDCNFYGFVGCFELVGADIYMRAKKIRLYKQNIFSFKEEN